MLSSSSAIQVQLLHVREHLQSALFAHLQITHVRCWRLDRVCILLLPIVAFRPLLLNFTERFIKFFLCRMGMVAVHLAWSLRVWSASPVLATFTNHSSIIQMVNFGAHR